jgi:PilZ domain
MNSVPGQVVQAPVHGHVRVARAYRHPVHTLAYVRIDHGNGGIVRNLSEHGMGIQAVARLHAEQVVHLRFEIIRPRARFDLVAQVSWADASGQAGLRFVEISEKMRRMMKDWLFTDLLIAAMELSPAGAPLLSAGASHDGLIKSSVPLLPIQLASAAGTAVSATAGEMPLRLSWWPGDIGPRTLARLIDGLIVVAAALLFSIIASEMTAVVPSWPKMLASEAGILLAFGLVYRKLFQYLVGSTLGARLAKLAGENLDWLEETTEDVPRFR